MELWGVEVEVAAPAGNVGVVGFDSGLIVLGL